MKKWNFKKRFQVNIDDLDDRMLLINVYLTQAITLVVGLVLIWIQRIDLVREAMWSTGWSPVIWGLGLAVAVVLADLAVTRFVPEDVLDDGGINERIFGNRPLWHIALLSLVVAICEETMFRGAIQPAIGAYWTSILFAAIHVRYLRHWLMTGMVFSISYALGWVYMKTGTLWTPIVAHFAIDFVMGCILRFRKEED